MKRKDMWVVIGVGFIAALFSYIIANAIFNSSSKHNDKIPVVQPISADFPQVQSDPTYQAFFNEKALDPTQLIQIGTSQNQKPFTGTQ